MNNIFIFWNIGRIAYEKRNDYDNVVEKLSNYFSYSFGNSINYTRENIHMMKKFYLDFPIFYKKLDSISWEQYKVILSINEKKERYFYFYLSLIFHSNYDETISFIKNNYYYRI